MVTQPDFQTLFFESLGGKPRRQRYRVRHDSNFHHDLQFLRSLVHDARVDPTQASLRGQRLRIRLHRDCWEYGLQRADGGTELRVANSLLKLHPVHHLEWQLPHHHVAAQAPELWLNTIHAASDYWDRDRLGWSLMLQGHDWGARVYFAADEPTIQLDDQEVPYYHSERHESSAT